jgi:hypothetical protein
LCGASREGERGNLAFAVHRSTDDPRAFWLYETWSDVDAVADHESAALGFGLGDGPAEGGGSLPRRFIRALGTNDQALLDAVHDPDVAPYTPLGWPIRGRQALKDFVTEFHTAYPGLRVTLHDEFASADGTRACFRFVIHFHNSGPFYGNPPTGERGTMSETHAVRIRDGRIVEQIVGDNNFSMPYQELVAWRTDFPRETPDPSPVIAEASADT